jgi:hypothetical protein
MIEKRRPPSKEYAYLLGSSIPPRSKTFKTRAGKLLLRDFCPPALVESLKADSGLHAFAHQPEREHQLLVNIAKQPDSSLTLAYTSGGEIVGELSLAPGDAWWEGLQHVYELGGEVSTHWRRLGIARQMLCFALKLDVVEEMILLAMGLSWHWDTEGLGLSRYRYRELLAQVLAPFGFVEYLTSEPNISMDPANILLVRIGSRVDPYTMNQFFQRLLSSQHLPGM